MQSIKIFTFIGLVTTIFIASCSQNKALVINRGNIKYPKDSWHNKSKYFGISDQLTVKVKNTSTEITKIEERQLTNIVEIKDSKNNTLKKHQIIVNEGDTLYSLSKKHSVILNDLIVENNLTPPYLLKAGMVLSLPKPIYHEVKSGETIYGISRQYQVAINDLYAFNDFGIDTNIKIGQKIRISQFSRTRKEVGNQEKINSPIVESKDLPSSVSQNKEGAIKEGIIVENIQDSSAQANKNIDDTKKDYQFTMPTKGTIISKFGPKEGGLYNDGIVIKANLASDVVASESGTIAYVGNQIKGYGNLIIVKHQNGWITAYGHLGKILAKIGSTVSQGKKIAEVGQSGNAKITQLYFSIRRGRDALDPEVYIADAKKKVKGLYQLKNPQ